MWVGDSQRVCQLAKLNRASEPKKQGRFSYKMELPVIKRTFLDVIAILRNFAFSLPCLVVNRNCLCPAGVIDRLTFRKEKLQ